MAKKSRHTPFSTRVSSLSDNTFRTATDLGTVRSSIDPVKFRFRGSISPSDTTDIYKFKVAPGVAFSSDKTAWEVSGGRINFSVYTKHPLFTNNKISFVDSLTLSGSGSDINKPGLFNDSQDTATIYIKFTTSSEKDVKYDISAISKP